MNANNVPKYTLNGCNCFLKDQMIQTGKLHNNTNIKTKLYIIKDISTQVSLH